MQARLSNMGRSVPFLLNASILTPLPTRIWSLYCHFRLEFASLTKQSKRCLNGMPDAPFVGLFGPGKWKKSIDGNGWHKINYTFILVWFLCNDSQILKWFIDRCAIGTIVTECFMYRILAWASFIHLIKIRVLHIM